MSDADLVARLHAFFDGNMGSLTASDIREAAAAIERLRAALAASQKPEGEREESVAAWLRTRGYRVEALAGAGDDPDYGAPCSRCGKVTCECST